MPLFGAKKKKVETTQPAVASSSAAQQASLTSGRMATLYRRMYRWVFAVNVSTDVYQIESGEDTFATAPLPMRGYYHTLLERMQDEMMPEQAASFTQTFSAENVRRALRMEKTSLTGRYCAHELGVAAPEEATWLWYEFRMEWQKETDSKNILCLLYVRCVQDDMDDGETRHRTQALRRGHRGEIDWDVTRALRLQQAHSDLRFEYEIAEDRLVLHRGQSEKHTSVTERFLTTLRSCADVVFSHDSVDEILHLFRANPQQAEERVVICRKDATFGAPFRHYRMQVIAVEEGGSHYLIGNMEDVEEVMRESERGRLYGKALDNLFERSGISIFHINTMQGTISAIVQDEQGFHPQDSQRSLADYVHKRIAAGRIAPESQQEYLNWLENGYLQRKTALGIYTFEARMRDMNDVEYQWYGETILSLEGKPGQFLRWQRNETQQHMAREVEYENKQLCRMGEYNRQMLDTMASLIEFRSVESSEHISRVRELTKILLEDMRKRCPQYELNTQRIDYYVQASVMHDIGKISVPDYILNKNGRLTAEEYEIMKRHTTDGAAIVDRISMSGGEELQSCIRDVVLHHHERYDGRGYPQGLAGDEIDIGVQAVSLADVYDALVSTRCYKQGYSSEMAMQMILEENQRKAFNPHVIESLRACEEKMRSVYAHDDSYVRLRQAEQ